MYNFPSIWPYEREMKLPPEGSLPVTGGQLPISRMDADQQLKNPVTSTPASVAQGQQLYMVYCALCHGPNAKGDGIVAAKLTAPPPDLTSEFVQARSDGFIFGTIRYGGVIMPALGSSLSADETWAIVNYVRSLK
jgi:mono/diheme cytochrome c family protein